MSCRRRRESGPALLMPLNEEARVPHLRHDAVPNWRHNSRIQWDLSLHSKTMSNLIKGGVELRNMIIFVLSLTLLVVANHAQAQHVTVALDQDISHDGNVIGRVDNLRLSAGNLTLSVLFFSNMFSVLDATRGAKGDLETDHWSRRIYWVGDTRVISEVGKSADYILLETRIKYEQWTRIDLLFTDVKTRLFQDTKTVVWLLTIPESELWNIRLIAKIVNIKDFPDSLEDWLDLRITESLSLSFPASCGTCDCQDFSQKSGAKLSDIEFVRSGDDSISTHASFSFTKDIDLSACWSL